jgi:hypothetical protein
LLYRSNFTATLVGIPAAPDVLGPYPNAPPKFPMAELFAPWIVKVIPSAVLVPPEIRKVKSVVKF